MTAEFDPVRPVHPTWPGRRVPGKGEERKRRPDADQEGEPGNGDAGGSEPGDRDDRTGNPPDSGGSGRHVDDYA